MHVVIIRKYNYVGLSIDPSSSCIFSSIMTVCFLSAVFNSFYVWIMVHRSGCTSGERQYFRSESDTVHSQRPSSQRSRTRGEIDQPAITKIQSRDFNHS